MSEAELPQRDATTFDQVFGPTRIPKVAELLADKLRDAIVSGRLPQGYELPPEARLLKTFDVGRPALREALHLLESEALLKIRRGVRGGAFVTVPSLSVPARAAGRLLQFKLATLKDVYETQTILESAAASAFAYQNDAAAREVLREMLEKWKRVGADPLEWSQAANSFHEALVTGCGSDTLAVLAGILREITEQQTHQGAAEAARAGEAEALAEGARGPRKLMRLIDQGRGAEAGRFWTEYRENIAAWWFVSREGQTVLDLFATANDDGGHDQKLAATVAVALRERIVRGELSEGDYLPSESRLAESMGVGLPTVREALRVLESEELVVVKRGARGGARVLQPTTAAAARSAGIILEMQHTPTTDILETQALLESVAAGRIAAHGSAADVRKLATLCEQSEEDTHDQVRWEARRAIFRANLLRLSGLVSLEFLADILRDISNGRIEGLEIFIDNPPAEVELQAQRQLVKFLRSKDADAASSYWSLFLSSIRPRIWETRRHLTQ